MKLRGRHRPVHFRPDEEFADVRVGFEQHGRREQNIVNPNDALFVQLHVVDKRRPAVQREIQRVVQVVIQVRPGADEEVDQPALHHLDDAAAEACGCEGTGNRQRNRRIVLGQQHLVAEDAARLAEPRGVERLESFVDQMVNVGAAARAVVANRLSGEVLLACFARRSGRAVRHKTWRARLCTARG